MGTIKTHYVELFEDDPEGLMKAQDLAERSHELISFLTNIMGISQIDATYDGTVTYHDSCAGLRELGIQEQPRRLLDGVQGIAFKELKDSIVCCGFGGTFCVKYPEISGKMVDDKCSRIEESGADTVLAGDLGCLLNIAGRLRRRGETTRVYHIAEVLAGMAGGPSIGDGEN
jgi:L-lactate dehydrogenase complex protein LldE